MRTIRLPSRAFRAEGYRRTANGPYFSLKQKQNHEGRWRVGVVVGAAVHKSAAKRNFWKRQARETLRALIPQAGAPRDLLLILFPKVNLLTKKQFREKLKHGLSL